MNEVKAEACGAIRNLAIEGGAEVCAEVRNKTFTIHSPMTCFPSCCLHRLTIIRFLSFTSADVQ